VSGTVFLEQEVVGRRPGKGEAAGCRVRNGGRPKSRQKTVPDTVSISPTQLMDISLLHELEHKSNKIGNPDDPSVELQLWNDCIK
jgi:hypothetical protein